MAVTSIRGKQVLDGSIQRADLDVTTVGQAVVAKVIQGTNLTLSSTGGDSGTGDVTVSLAAHATTHKSGGSDSIALDTLAVTTDITTLNSSTTAHGLLPKLSNVANQYMNGTGGWTTPASGGGFTATTSSTFTIPSAGSTVAIALNSTTWGVVGQLLLISDGTRFLFCELTTRTSNTAWTVTARAYQGNNVSGTMSTAASVTLVSPGQATATLGGLLPAPPNSAAQVLLGTGAFGTLTYSNLGSIPTTFAPSAHATSHKSGGSDAIALDTLAATTDITTLNSSTTAHGLLPKLSNVAGQYLNGTGGWTVPTPPATSLGVFIESPTNKTYTLDLDAPSAYTVIKLSIITVSGTCTVALNRNGTGITGATAVSVTSTLATVTLSQACVAGDTITLVVSAVSSVVDLSASVRVQP